MYLTSEKSSNLIINFDVPVLLNTYVQDEYRYFTWAWCNLNLEEYHCGLIAYFTIFTC